MSLRSSKDSLSSGFTIDPDDGWWWWNGIVFLACWDPKGTIP